MPQPPEIDATPPRKPVQAFSPVPVPGHAATPTQGHSAGTAARRLCGLVLLIAVLAMPAHAQEHLGVSVIDGDTLEWRGERIRLWGIDAPETDQECPGATAFPTIAGMASTSALQTIIAQAEGFRCDALARDTYGRTVAQCYADGGDIAELMVLSGWAMDWPRYSGGAYAAFQQAAQDANIGMWALDCRPPWEWRRQVKF